MLIGVFWVLEVAELLRPSNLEKFILREIQPLQQFTILCSLFKINDSSSVKLFPPVVTRNVAACPYA